MLRHIAILLILSLGFPSLGVAEENEGRAAPKPDAAPLLLLYGDFEATRSVAQAMRDVARRDGGAFVDLSPAPQPPPSAPAELRHAIAAYQEFDYGRAMKHLSAAMKEVRTTGAHGLSNSELCDLFIYRALVRSAQGDSSAAWDDFVQAALVDPTRHLDAVRFSPSVAASFERARKEVGESVVVSLTVQVASDCVLAVDGLERDLAAAVVVRAGTHFVRVECPGYKIYSDVLLLDSDQVVQPSLTKETAPSTTEILTIAKERGFRNVVFAYVPRTAHAATALLTLVGSDGGELGRTAVTLTTRQEDRALVMVAMSRLLDALSPAAGEPIVVHEKRSWYERPWLWATAGVAITTAVLLPFALQGKESAGFRIELGGATP